MKCKQTARIATSVTAAIAVPAVRKTQSATIDAAAATKHQIRLATRCVNCKNCL